VVVDASALIDAVQEPLARRAFWRLATQQPLVAPDHVDAEVASSFQRLSRAGEVGSAIARGLLENAVLGPVVRVPSRVLVLDAWALRDNFSAYDALYVCLAQKLGCELLTNDERLRRACQGVIPAVALPNAG